MGENKHEKPCPSCGHCPTCGRGGASGGWWRIPPQPYWYYVGDYPNYTTSTYDGADYNTPTINSSN